MNKLVWTSEQDSIIIEAIKNNIGYIEISKILKRRYQAIIERAKKLNIYISRNYPKNIIDQVIELSKKQISRKKIKEITNVSISSINRIRFINQIKLIKKWTEKDIENLKI